MRVEDISFRGEDISFRVEDVSSRVEDISFRVEDVSSRIEDISFRVEDVSPIKNAVFEGKGQVKLFRKQSPKSNSSFLFNFFGKLLSSKTV